MNANDETTKARATAVCLCAFLWVGAGSHAQALDAPVSQERLLDDMLSAGATPGMLNQARQILQQMGSRGLNVPRNGPAPAAAAGVAPANGGPSLNAMLANPGVAAFLASLSKMLPGGASQDIVITIGRRGSRPMVITLAGSGREAQQQQQQPRRGGKSQLSLLPPVGSQVTP